VVDSYSEGAWLEEVQKGLELDGKRDLGVNAAIVDLPSELIQFLHSSFVIPGPLMEEVPPNRSTAIWKIKDDDFSI